MRAEDLGKGLVREIDRAVESVAEDGRRRHLGASILGRRCVREVYYSWRWFYAVKHTGRILRLFARGQDEEARLIPHLEAIGFEVRPTAQRLVYHMPSDSYALLPWDHVAEDDLDDLTGIGWAEAAAKRRGLEVSQHRVSAHNGHFGGSQDGQAIAPERYQNLLPGVGLLEFKTHGDKSFKALVDGGVQSAKLEHYVQMQLYMHLAGLRWGLYVAVNKNDDHLHIEVVYPRPEIALAYLDRAKGVIYAERPPERITTNAAWWECKFCDFREVCHHDQAPQKNCRTCVFSRPSDDPERPGAWVCGKFHGAEIPPAFAKKGCDAWEAIQG